MTSDKASRIFRPSMLGSWFLFAGLLMGPAIIVFDRDPQGRTLLWTLMAVFFLGLVLHRLGTSYRMDGRALTIRRWWGLFGDTVIPYGEISRVDTRRSFASSLVGGGHVLVATGGGDWETILSQKDPEALQRELERLAGEAPAPALDFSPGGAGEDASESWAGGGEAGADAGGAAEDAGEAGEEAHGGAGEDGDGQGDCRQGDGCGTCAGAGGAAEAGSARASGGGGEADAGETEGPARTEGGEA
ncbi:MAG: hypothetical protein LBG06_06090 [Deltaproteobacteria bacterium]|jgi:hypothetical protein|nr:hypothetical protein [Deltaproteobacteria bacterium]